MSINSTVQKAGIRRDLPVTEFLLGSDLKSVLAAIESSSKLGPNMTQSNRGIIFSPQFPPKTEHGGTGTDRGGGRVSQESDLDPVSQRDQGSRPERPERPERQRPMDAGVSISDAALTAEVSAEKRNRDIFEAGRLKHYVSQWQQLTSDPFIIDTVKGAEIPITDNNG